MLSTVEGLVRELRTIGIPVSTTEHIDAARALKVIDIGDRSQVKAALAATMVKRIEHLPAFNTVFDLFFSGLAQLEGALEETGEEGSPNSVAAMLNALDDDELREMLINATENNDELMMNALVEAFVNRKANIQKGAQVAGNLYVFRVLRSLDLPDVREQLIERQEIDPESPGADLQQRIAESDADHKVELLQQKVEAAVRMQLVADRGAGAVARSLRSKLPEDIDFLTGSTAEIEALQWTLAPLPVQLAQKLAAKRSHGRHGVIDFRGTVRHSMSTGGVPVDIAYKKPHPPKPELIVLADISGSVSSFATFTLQLTFAIRSQFRSVRSFVFIDGMDEVTDIMQSADNIAEAAARIDDEKKGFSLDGRSDYGSAFRSFVKRWGMQINSRSIVLILGDGRSNYRQPSEDMVEFMAKRAHRVFWLNPEREVSWGEGDSVMPKYAKHCSKVFECRNVRQLKEFIDELD